MHTESQAVCRREQGQTGTVGRQGKEYQKYSREKIDDVVKEASFRVGYGSDRAQNKYYSPTNCSTPEDRSNEISCHGYLYLNRSLFPDKAKVFER